MLYFISLYSKNYYTIFCHTSYFIVGDKIDNKPHCIPFKIAVLIISFHIHMQSYCTIYILFRKNHHDFVKFYMVHIWGQILASLGKLGQFLRQVSIYKESYDGLRRVCGGLRRSLAIYGKSQRSMARYDSMVKDGRNKLVLHN